ncbi:helix-turn-helix domain-containing protein [Endothiovibrio diazotrophicus]
MGYDAERRNQIEDELAERTHTTTVTISNIERGIHGPRFDLLMRICDVLEVEAKALFTFDE